MWNRRLYQEMAKLHNITRFSWSSKYSRQIKGRDATKNRPEFSWSQKRHYWTLPLRIFQSFWSHVCCSTATRKCDSASSNLKIGDNVKADFLEIAQKHAAYQKGHISQKTVEETGGLEAMATAKKNLAESMQSKPNISCLKRLSVPTWDGNRKTYATWKRKFHHWMTKYNQEQDEQLQRFRKAMPKNFSGGKTR